MQNVGFLMTRLMSVCYFFHFALVCRTVVLIAPVSGKCLPFTCDYIKQVMSMSSLSLNGILDVVKFTLRQSLQH